MPKKALVFLSAHDPENVLNWSGTLHALFNTLRTENPDLDLYPVSGGWLDRLAEQFNRLLYLFGLRFDFRFSRYYAVCTGLYVSLRLVMIPRGPILAVAASNYVPYLFTGREIIYISDAPFRANAEMYSNLRNLPRWLYRQFDDNEARTLRKAKSIILPTKWAVDSAKQDYEIESKKIFELPFGANISNKLIDQYYRPKTIVDTKIVLLFVSADWERKGGDKALAICQALRKRGIAAQLTIVGDSPNEAQQLDFVDAKGFLNKADRAQLEIICTAYEEANFLLLPTKADASPIVFSECRAFGVPPVAHMVGGVASVIEHGHTGLLLPIDASADEFAAELMPYIEDQYRYEKLSRECRTWYVEKAQWTNWNNLILNLAGLNDRGP